MSVYCVTGKLGNGKTLVTVGRIRDALRQGLRVATNLDINLKAMFGKDAKNIDFIRIPDKPTLQDLEAIGKGADGSYDESKFGVLVLDECGTWFNSRNWQDKTRMGVNNWFLHSRKLRWHVYIIIQDISILDAQARDAICEMLVVCRRLDNLRIPIIGAWCKLITGINLTLPRIHRAKVTYADGLLCDVWVYRGNDLFSCYETDQCFLENYDKGVHSILPPYYTHGRYKKPLTWDRFMRMTKIVWKRFASPVALATGVLLGISVMLFNNSHRIEASLVRPALAATVSSQSSSSSSSVATSSASRSKNPFAGLTFYYVADVDGGMLFEVVYADKTTLTLNQRDLRLLGFTVVRVNPSTAQVIFEGEVTYAFVRPRPPYEPQISNQKLAMAKAP